MGGSVDERHGGEKVGAPIGVNGATLIVHDRCRSSVDEFWFGLGSISCAAERFSTRFGSIPVMWSRGSARDDEMASAAPKSARDDEMATREDIYELGVICGAGGAKRWLGETVFWLV